MTAAEIMFALAACDAQVVIEGNRVRVRFPVGHPPPATLVEAARAHRATLREMLERRLAVKHYDGPMAVLKSECPPGIESGRWRQAISDADTFLATWGEQAASIGWTAQDLFGLAEVPDRSGPNYQRLSRYDQTGLIWLLQGRSVVALTEDSAFIGTANGTLSYRRHNNPGLGSTDDMEPPL
jgi:hypothetical protein